MPLQNRVDPYGAIFRSPARGAMMGNRGILHNESRELVRRWNGRRWIACVLEFKDRHRLVMAPRRYTELFFLDEAVAFAAGHRPCAECRRERFNAFKRAWHHQAWADEIDLELHRSRIDGCREKLTYRAELAELPNGSFITIDGAAYLAWDDALYLWSPEGYTRKTPQPDRLKVTVLTPRPIVECFAAGYQPETHASMFVL